jgi:ferritin-like metal-binding protein YciE
MRRRGAAFWENKPMTRLTANLGGVERCISMLLGVGLTLAALRQGTRLQRASAGVAGISLLTRGVTGYCAVKDVFTGAPPRIDSLENLYVSELQELRSAEAQLQSFLPKVLESFQSSSFEQLLSGYTAEVQARIAALDQVISATGAPGRHVGGGMHALIAETRMMTQIGAVHVRGAALLASLQRLIHFMIAGYGAVATYAATLDREDEAGLFHGYVEREKETGLRLTSLAKAMTNPEARAQPATQAERPAGLTNPR